MRTYSEADIRDVALIGHGGAGKTSLGEAILYDTKAVSRLGRVDEENSNLDFIDTSGQGDFLVDTLIAIAAADSAVCVVSAADGVQVYTEKTWEEASGLGLPRLIFINKMDRERADFASVVEQVVRTLSEKAVPIVLPIVLTTGQESSFTGIVDL